MASLSDQICDHPMFFAQLNRLHRQREQFTPPKATPNQHREHRSVALTAESIGAGALQQPLALLSGKPISDSYPQPTNSFHTPYAGRKFWTEQTGISCLIGTNNDDAGRNQTYQPTLGSTFRRSFYLCLDGEQVIEQSICPLVFSEVRLCSRLQHRSLAVLVIVG